MGSLAFKPAGPMTSPTSLPLITIIGSLNKDLVTRTPRIPSAGETLTASSFTTGSGGKGANQAVACARLTRYKSDPKAQYAFVNMIGVVGDDAFGCDLRSGLVENGIDVSKIKVKQGQQTGVAVVIVEEDSGENRILVLPNANSALRPEDLESLPAPVPDLIVLQLEIPLRTVLRIIQVAKEERIEVLLNPAPALELPDEVYQGLSHLILNQTEAAILSRGSEALPPSEIGTGFLNLGVQNVVITLGGEGAICFKSRENPVIDSVGAEKLKVVDTTAAGDTFVGAYASKVAQHKRAGTPFDLRGAVTWATRAAGLTVQKEGAQASIPWLDDMPSDSKND